MCLCVTVVTKCDEIIRMIRSSRCKRNKMMQLEIDSVYILRCDFGSTSLALLVISFNNSLANRFSKAS